MQVTINTRLHPSEFSNESLIRQHLADQLGKPLSSITGFHIQKKSLDARSRQVWINLMLEVFIDEPFIQRKPAQIVFQDVSGAHSRVIVIGAGPCGLFAALKLITLGIQPIVLERGKNVRDRRRDLAILNKEGIINPESNYCFGEGGAGTYSDGKLYTRSSKRGDINRILNLLVQFGAPEEILFEAHPHIGTNKLPQIITAIRNQITDCGGQFLFQQKVDDFILKENKIIGVHTAAGLSLEAAAVILATGHSARDIFQLLSDKKIAIASKPFALGVRIEHPQSLIDSIQYHCVKRDNLLPPASYGLVQQVENRGVFSFCMCPGGIIAPAATNPGEIVVNGWSPSKRNNPFANSGMVVQIEQEDIHKLILSKSAHGNTDPELGGMLFQQSVEQLCYQAGGGKFVAPAQGLMDFITNKSPDRLPDCSYLPGVKAVNLQQVLPGFVNHSLREGLKIFGKKMRGYLSQEAILVATESRTSSPVRIPRDPNLLHHPQIINLYPAGEGAGYAGGIVSAAMDGENVANLIGNKLMTKGFN